MLVATVAAIRADPSCLQYSAPKAVGSSACSIDELCVGQVTVLRRHRFNDLALRCNAQHQVGLVK